MKGEATTKECVNIACATYRVRVKVKADECVVCGHDLKPVDLLSLLGITDENLSDLFRGQR